MNETNSPNNQGQSSEEISASAWEFFIAKANVGDTKPKREKARVTDWIVALFTIFLTVVGGLQWNAIKGQLSEMKSSGKQTDDLICLYREQVGKLPDQVSQTHELVRQAIISNTNTVDAFHKTERPWVNAESFEVVGIHTPQQLSSLFGNKSTIKTITHLRNTGKSIATNGWTMVSLIQGSSVEKLNSEWHKSCDLVRQSKANFTSSTSNAHWPLGFVLTPGQDTPFESGMGNVTLHEGEGFRFIGCSVYDDQYGGPSHHTTFCYQFTNSGTEITFIPCNGFAEAN